MHDLNTIRQINAAEVRKAQPALIFVLTPPDFTGQSKAYKGFPIRFAERQATSPRRFARHYLETVPGAHIAHFATFMADRAKDLAAVQRRIPHQKLEVHWARWILEVRYETDDLLSEYLRGDPWYGAR